MTVAAVYYMFTLRINMKTQQLALKAQEQNLETRQAELFMGPKPKPKNAIILSSHANGF